MMYAFSSSLPLSCIRRDVTAKTQMKPRPHAKMGAMTRRAVLNLTALSAIGSALYPGKARAGRPEGVNRPELLPAEFTTVLDYENFLARGEEERLVSKIADLETKSGYKLRVLTQRFPQTPGLAVRSFWELDDNSILLVADYFGGDQLLKFNVGKNVDAKLPPIFWSRLQSALGNKFYIEKFGESGAIIQAIDNIRTCLLSSNICSKPPYVNDTKF